jgi:ribulose-phosphate 3-epimerase
MSKPYLIAASILSADFTRLDEQIKTAEMAGAHWIHVDVMDGHFVPNLTMGPFIVEACRRITSLPLDVHLMVYEPERMIESFAKAGSTNLTVHFETCPNLHRTLQMIRELGCHPGVVLNPGTPACMIEPILHLVDIVLIMSVNPGYSGQTFLPEVISKVTHIRKILDQVNPQAVVEIDGGLNAQTMPLAIQAGAQVFVAASAIFRHPAGITAGVQTLADLLPK